MGGRWVMDSDCGCIPHHYSLSIDEKSNQDNRTSSTAVHIEMSGHTEIPLKFNDDGSFTGEAQMSLSQSGYTQMPRLDCNSKGSVEVKFKVKGTVEEGKKVLHLVLSPTSSGGSVTNTCSNSMTTTTPFPGVSKPRDMPWDMPSFIGVDQHFPMPYQNPPTFTSSMKVRIDQTD